MNETKTKRPDGFEIAREWFEQWGPRLSEEPWHSDVPHEGQHQLGAMIERALSVAYRAGADHEGELYRR